MRRDPFEIKVIDELIEIAIGAVNQIAASFDRHPFDFDAIDSPTDPRRFFKNNDFDFIPQQVTGKISCSCTADA